MSGGFKRGNLIFTSKPFVYVLQNNVRSSYCDHCFKGSSNLLRCSQCSFAYYCDKDCQAEAWQIHKIECKNIKRSSPAIPSDSLKLMGRLLWKLKQPGAELISENVGTYTRTFESMESHVEEIENDVQRCKQVVGMLHSLKKYIGEKYLPSATEFLHIFGKMVINSFSIWNGEMQIIGSGLYLGASILDHSCDPDAIVVYDGNILCLRAVRDIPHSDIKKIYISYIDERDTSLKRKQQLKDRYYFTCKCCKCNDSKLDSLMTEVQNLSKAEGPEGVIAHSKETLRKLKEMNKNNDDPLSILKLAKICLKEQEGVLSNMNLLRVEILDQAFDASVKLQHWEEAIHFGMPTLEAYRCYYGSYHANLGIQLFRIGKIQLLLGYLEDGERYLTQAEEILAVTHGIKHHIYQDLMALIMQTQEERRIKDGIMS